MAEREFERLQWSADEPLLIVLDNDDPIGDSDSDHDADGMKMRVEQRVTEPTKAITTSSEKRISKSCRPTNPKRLKCSRDDARPSSSTTDSILSTLHFDEKIEVLTVSRMGSTYYCLEDLHRKAFASLCKIDELVKLLERSALVLVKKATLSEKIAIEEKNPKLKLKLPNARHQLLSINAADHLRRLKVLLLNQHKYQQLEEIINGIDLQPTTSSSNKRTVDEIESTPTKTTNKTKTKKKKKTSTSSSQSSATRAEEYEEIVSCGNISSIKKPTSQKPKSPEEIIVLTPSPRQEEVNSPLQVITEPPTPMPQIVSVEESVSMELPKSIPDPSPTSSTEKASTDRHCPESSICKDTIENPSVLLPIIRQPIHCYSYHNPSPPTDNRLHRVPSGDPPTVTPPAQVTTPVNILSGMVNRSLAAIETSFSFQTAVLEHALENIDLSPKLFVRQTKHYLRRTLNMTGRLFPTWLVPPDFRCVHCFTCDRVYTPQQFMIHTDEKELRSETPLRVSPIQLLKSERLSPEKVQLWNQFCRMFNRHNRNHERQENNVCQPDHCTGSSASKINEQSAVNCYEFE